MATATSLSLHDGAAPLRLRTAATDYRALLDDESIDAVFVVTRHSPTPT